MLLIIHDTASTNPNQTYSPRRTHPPTPQLTQPTTDSSHPNQRPTTASVPHLRIPIFFFFPSPFPLNLSPTPYQLTLEKFSCRSLRNIIQKHDSFWTFIISKPLPAELDYLFC